MKRRVGQYAFTFLLMFAIGLGLPISPLLASRMGASWVDIGLMGSAWGVVFTFSAFLTGRISDRIGRRPALTISAALSALAALLFLRASSVPDLIAIRGLEGLAWACFWPPMEALATESAETEQVGRGIGLVTSIYALAFATGSSAGGFIAGFFGFAFAFAAYLGIAFLATLSVGLIERPRQVGTPKPLAGILESRLFSRTTLMGNVLAASYTFGLASIMTLLSVYAASFGIPVLWIGVAFSMFWAGRILGGAFAGGASDRFGRKGVALLSLIVGCTGFLAVGLAADLLFLVTGVLLAGLSVGAIFPVNVAIIADDTEPELRGSAMGFYEMTCGIAFMAASTLGGLVAEVVSPGSPFGLSAVVFVSCAIALSVLLPERPRGSFTLPEQSLP